MVYKRIDFRREWYTRGWILDGRGIQKDDFYTRVAFERIDFTREEYGKENIATGSSKTTAFG